MTTGRQEGGCGGSGGGKGGVAVRRKSEWMEAANKQRQAFSRPLELMEAPASRASPDTLVISYFSSFFSLSLSVSLPFLHSKLINEYKYSA